MSLIRSLVRKSQDHEKANVLCFFYDGFFDLELAKTGHNFYGVYESSIYRWDYLFNLKPDNINLVSNSEITSIDYDLILFSHRIKHQKYIKNHQVGLQLPSIVIDHEPYKENTYQLFNIANSPNIINVAINDGIYNKKLHKYRIPAVEQTYQDYEKDIDIIISGYFNERTPDLVNRVLKKYPNSVLIEKAIGEYNNAEEIFQRAKIYLNVTSRNSVSTELLYAIKNNCNILISHKEATSSLIDDFCVIKNYDDMFTKIDRLLNNEKYAEKCKVKQQQTTMYDIESINQIILESKNRIWIT